MHSFTRYRFFRYEAAYVPVDPGRRECCTYRMDPQRRYGLRDYPECRTVGGVDEPPTKPWPDSLTAVIGRRVAQFRKGKLTAQQLSDALRERLGVDMKRSVIGDLENGVRRTVSVSEVLALAYVLGVPPLLLIVPLGEPGDVEVLPGVWANPWAVARWAAGEGVMPPELGGATPEYGSQFGLLQLGRWHNDLIESWEAARHVAAGGPAPEGDPLALARLGSLTNEIARIRWLIRQAAAEPPPLPPQLRYLDDRPVSSDA